ncbi:hypothetical protein DPMN_100004 [Dreissena polymorpha]|uniref:Uncharacterized protein n=1 Tax=Dreissena polymorpha TaxID=45954 RepID=A0A9D4LHE2_DREPO|nr:hypothetical protein DPMN_100004 [Dreissena polymorpha]
MRSSLWGHWCSKACILHCVSALSAQVTKPYSRTGTCVLGWYLMELLVYNLLRLVIAADAMMNRVPSSAVLVPSFDRVASKNLKLMSSFSFLPFMMMYKVVLLVLLTIIFDFNVLSSITYAPALSYSLFVMSWSSLLEPPMRAPCIIFSSDGLSERGKADILVGRPMMS